MCLYYVHKDRGEWGRGTKWGLSFLPEVPWYLEPRDSEGDMTKKKLFTREYQSITVSVELFTFSLGNGLWWFLKIFPWSGRVRDEGE